MGSFVPSPDGDGITEGPGQQTGPGRRGIRSRLEKHKRPVGAVVFVVLIVVMVLLLPEPLEPRMRGGDAVMGPEPACYLEWDTSVTNRSVDQTYRWDIVLDITQVQVLDREPRWAGAEVDVDPYVLWELRERVDMGPMPQDFPDGLGAFYVDNGGSPDGPDVGDQIVITGLTRVHQGAEMTFGNDDFRGSVRVPLWTDQPYSLTLSEPSCEVTDAEGRVWSTYVGIESVNPPDERIPWEWLYVRSDRWGVDGLIVEDPYPGSDRIGGETAAYFEDMGTNNGFVDPGDRLWVSGIGSSWGEARFDVNSGSVHLDRFNLPRWMPHVNGTCTLSAPELSTRTVDGTIYSDLTWTVTDMRQVGTDPIPWRKTYMQVGRPYGLNGLTFHSLNDNNHYGTSPQGWVDDTDHDGFVSAGDLVHLTGQNHGSDNYATGFIILHRFGMAVGTGRIPDILPGMDSTIALDYLAPTLQGIHFSVTYQVRWLSPDDLVLPWSSLNFSIIDGESNDLVEPRMALNEGEADATVTPTGWYMEAGSGDGMVSIGDNVTVSGLSKRHLGTRLHLDLNGTGLSMDWITVSIEVPDVGDVAIGVDGVEVERVPVNGTEAWRSSFVVVNVTGVGGDVTWGDVTIDLVSWNGTILEEALELSSFPPAGGTEWTGYNTLQLSSWYIDGGKVDGVVDAGDVIALTGLSEDQGSVRVYVRVDGMVAFSYVLPSTLPG